MRGRFERRAAPVLRVRLTEAELERAILGMVSESPLFVRRIHERLTDWRAPCARSRLDRAVDRLVRRGWVRIARHAIEAGIMPAVVPRSGRVVVCTVRGAEVWGRAVDRQMAVLALWQSKE